jgi:endo-1,4-beta-xylanase
MRTRILASICIAALAVSCGGGGRSTSTPPVAPSPPPSLPDPASAPRLKDVLAANFPVGGAIEPSQLGVATDVALLQKHFNSITAENVMKPATIGTGPGTYNFAPADQLIQFAQTNAIQVRGHTLLWHQTVPTTSSTHFVRPVPPIPACCSSSTTTTPNSPQSGHAYWQSSRT